MVKLIVLDMDGTLLNDKKMIDPSFWDVAKEVMNKGIQMAVASGRHFFTLEDLFSSVKDKIVFISDNGAFVSYKGEVISKDPLPDNTVDEFIDIARTMTNAWLVNCGLHSAYVENDSEEFIHKVRDYYHRFQVVDDLKDVKDEILKMTVCDFNGAAAYSNKFFEPFHKEYKVVVAGEIWLDINEKHVNKGKAVTALQKSLKISPDETMVFGDYMNDFEMMKTAKYSFAMKNALPQIKDVANYETKFDNNENGVVETLRLLLSNYENFDEALK